MDHNNSKKHKDVVSKVRKYPLFFFIEVWFLQIWMLLIIAEGLKATCQEKEKNLSVSR